MQRRIHENSLANLNRFQPGQSGNPGGRPRGVPRLSNCYERLLKMSVEELQQFRPQNTAEAMALRQVSAAIYAWDALPHVKEITDRTEGKAIQRRIDLTEAEAVSKARMGYALLSRCAAKIQASYPLLTISKAEVILDVCAGIDEQYHEAVIRELEAMQ
jgi:Family of unknown function (DUF5681)